MATTTTNFGWDVPTSTDLVKNGATAISTLGQDIDTTMAELKGGTTGQVLSKTSNTDMDFTWVAQDDSNAIQNSIVDAKGDLIAAAANDTPARLAVGNNGETLVADSSTSTGLRYQAPVAANPLINSAFQIWQRGTSISLAAGAYNQYTADRWTAAAPANEATTISRQLTGDTTNLPFIQYCARWQRNSGQTGTATAGFWQNVETLNSVPFAGKTITYSFYARAGANWSPTSGNLGVVVYSGTGTDQNIFSGFTGSDLRLATNISLTTTWQRFQFVITMPSNMTEMAFGFNINPTGTAGANDYFEVTGLQVEVGSVATPFKTNGATIQGELAACQRYYYRNNASQLYEVFGGGSTTGTTTGNASVRLPVTMRVNPTAVEYSTLFYAMLGYGSGNAVTALTLASNVNSNNNPTVAVTSSGNTAGTYNSLYANASTSAYIAFTAEL